MRIPTTTEKPLLVVVTGPTAVGKTTVGIEIATALSSEIISADSRQFYKEMRIGTARPEPRELCNVRHHFLGHLSVMDPYDVSRFESDVLDLLDSLFSVAPVALLVGGSGLYINAVCHGIDQLPDPDQELRKELKELLYMKGIGALQEKLRALDPDYYQEVDLSNPNRLLRAVEVSMITGVPFSSLRKNKPKPRNFDILKIGLSMEREELNRRINARVDRMIHEGLVEEAIKLLPFRHLNALNTVGYRELFRYFDGDITLEKAIENIKTNTRRFAKRQMTWFRKDNEIRWFHPDEVGGMMEYILEVRGGALVKW